MVRHLQILIACSDSDSRHALEGVVSRCGLEPVSSSTVREALALIARGPVAAVVCAADLADGSFRDLLRATQSATRKTPVVVASRRGDPEEYLEAMQSGAFDFIACPYRRDEMEWILSHALHRKAAVAA